MYRTFCFSSSISTHVPQCSSFRTRIDSTQSGPAPLASGEAISESQHFETRRCHPSREKFLKTVSSPQPQPRPQLRRRIDPLWNRSKQEPVCAPRDFAPVVVAVEHLLQPVAKDRTQLLASRVRDVHQRGRPQGLTSPRNILRKNRARSPPPAPHQRPRRQMPEHDARHASLRERLRWLQHRFPASPRHRAHPHCALPKKLL